MSFRNSKCCYIHALNKVQQRSPHWMFQWQTKSTRYSTEDGNTRYNSAAVHNWSCFCLICVPAISMHPTQISQAHTKRTLYTHGCMHRDHSSKSLTWTQKTALMTVIHIILQHKQHKREWFPRICNSKTHHTGSMKVTKPVLGHHIREKANIKEAANENTAYKKKF